MVGSVVHEFTVVKLDHFSFKIESQIDKNVFILFHYIIDCHGHRGTTYKCIHVFSIIQL